MLQNKIHAYNDAQQIVILHECICNLRKCICNLFRMSLQIAQVAICANSATEVDSLPISLSLILGLAGLLSLKMAF